MWRQRRAASSISWATCLICSCGHATTCWLTPRRCPPASSPTWPWPWELSSLECLKAKVRLGSESLSSFLLKEHLNKRPSHPSPLCRDGNPVVKLVWLCDGGWWLLHGPGVVHAAVWLCSLRAGGLVRGGRVSWRVRSASTLLLLRTGMFHVFSGFCYDLQ